MEAFIENEKFIVHYIKELNIIVFKVIDPNITIEQKRKFWDITIDYMKDNEVDKIIIDESVIDYSNISNLLYVNEGLIQIMAGAIKSSILYCSIFMDERTFSTVNEKTKFNSEFNQFNEIEYKFFNSKEKSLKWLIDKPIYSKTLLSSIKKLIFKPKKTTIEDQFRAVQKNMDIKGNPIFEMYVDYQIKEFNKKNDK